MFFLFKLVNADEAPQYQDPKHYAFYTQELSPLVVCLPTFDSKGIANFQVELLVTKKKILGDFNTEVFSCKCDAAEITFEGNKKILKKIGAQAFSPCPALLINKTTHALVKFINNLERNCSDKGTLCQQFPPVTIHIHGLQNSQASDGDPKAFFTKNGTKGPNYNSARPCKDNEYVYEIWGSQGQSFLWYHDHVMDNTKNNVIMGLFGVFYIDLQENVQLKDLPSLEMTKFLVFTDRIFDKNGQFHVYKVEEFPEYFGNFSLVNGVIHPKLTVKRTTYRLCILNGNIDKYLDLKFQDSSGTRLNFTVIAYEQRFGGCKTVSSHLMGPGERVEFLIDFSKASDQVFLVDSAVAPFPSGQPMDQSTVMKFIVSGPVVLSEVFTPSVDLQALKQIKKATPDKSVQLTIMENPDTLKLTFNMQDYHSQLEKIVFSVGQFVEIIYINLTPDSHSLHNHMFPFLVFKVCKVKEEFIRFFKQTKAVANSSNYFYDCRETDENELAFRDTYTVHKLEVLILRAKVEGRKQKKWLDYCHMLSHQDNGLMFSFSIIDNRLPTWLLAVSITVSTLFIFTIIIIIYFYNRNSQQKQAQKQSDIIKENQYFSH